MKNFNYIPYIKSLVKFMLKHGFTLKPLPKIILNTQKQKGLFIMTGHYDYINNEVTVYIRDRHPKDVLRSLAHELIHHKQNVEGRLTDELTMPTEITEDENVVPFEMEAYLQGNIAFRSWTELYNDEK